MASAPAPAISLSADDARRLTLRAQGLCGASARAAGLPAMVRTLGAVQLDTISVLARSHELVAYARLGAVGRAHVEAGYWGGDTFEYWAHAACVLPLSGWPTFAFRRRHYRQRERLWSSLPAGTADVLDRLRADGPLTATDLGGAKATSTWWGWSEVKIAVEFLLAAGEVICTKRAGWRRVYDLPERVLPTNLLHDDLDDDSCRRKLITAAGRALAVATAADLADYFRLKRAEVAALLPETRLVPVQVQGWDALGWADPQALASPPRGRHRTTLLSPFDSLVWDRKRTARVFGFDHRLEAYVPKAQRKHGYFTMPLLAGGRLVARVDPARVDGTLVARQLVIEPASATPARLPATAEAIGTALREAARWVAATAVAVEHVEPSSAAGAVRAAIAQPG